MGRAIKTETQEDVKQAEEIKEEQAPEEEKQEGEVPEEQDPAEEKEQDAVEEETQEDVKDDDMAKAKKTVYVITAPNKSYTGLTASVEFKDGKGETDDKLLAEGYFKANGFGIEEKE